MKISEWQKAKKWLVRPARKADEEKVLLDYIDSVKEKYGDAKPKWKYEGFAEGQKQSDVTGQKNPNYKPPPKDFFEKLLPLPKNKYNHSKPKVKLEPLKYEYLPIEFDVEPIKAKKEIKRPKAEGITSVLNFHRIG